MPRTRNVIGCLVIVSSFACAAACEPMPSAQAPAGTKRGAPADPGTTRVVSLTVSNESLNVDKISMRDGIFAPDGNRDLAFTAVVEGPADALFLVTTTAKGEPLHGFRADTIAGHEELPPELGSVVDVGRLTAWIAVSENGKFINAEGGSLGALPQGPHSLRLYVPNTGMLRGGTHLRLYARTPSGVLIGGPPVPY